MLERSDHGLQVSEPTEPPMVEVDWRAWWVAIDKRIQEHLVNERELMLDSVGEALAIQRRELYDDERFRGPGRGNSSGCPALYVAGTIARRDCNRCLQHLQPWRNLL